MREAGWPLVRLVSVAVSHVCGLTPVSLQFSISVAITAQLSPPSSEPANRAFLRLRASGCGFRIHPGHDSDLIPAGVPI
jgi:hypothetical protein